MSETKVKVGDCFKTAVFGGYEYAIIVYDSGSGIYRADTVKITKNGFSAELNQHCMHWQFRECERITYHEFESRLNDVYNTIKLIQSGKTRNNANGIE